MIDFYGYSLGTCDSKLLYSMLFLKQFNLKVVLCLAEEVCVFVSL